MKLSTMSLAEKKALYLKAKKAYYLSEPLMPDSAFDKLEDSIIAADPDWKHLAKTGVKVKNEVPLFEFMPSLAKAYPHQADSWLKNNPSHEGYLVMDKLDGTSLQLRIEGGKAVSLLTRGDGENGKDVTHLLKSTTLPKSGATLKNATVRCEALFTKKGFKKWAEDFDNARNGVNGVFNRKTAHACLKDVHIVALGTYGSALLTSLGYAEQWGLEVVPHKVFKTLDSQKLTDYLEERKRLSPYEIDGLVIAPVRFAMKYNNSDKPKGITAFKVNSDDDAVQAEVLKIIYQVTGRRRIIPKILIKPVQIGGVVVKHATVHNGQWMIDRHVGPGAVVKLVRSGGVIPKIDDVVKKGKLQMPDITYKMEGVHFVTAKESRATSDRVDVLNIVKFMKTFGIEHVAAPTATKLQSKLPTPLAYVKAWKEDKLRNTITSLGFGYGQAKRINDEFDRVFSQKVKVRTLMVALQVFDAGIGDRKLKAIEDHPIRLGTLLKTRKLRELLQAVRGFSDRSIDLIESGLDKWAEAFTSFSEFLTIDDSLPQANKKPLVKGKLTGQCVSWTGYRSKDEETAVEAAGGLVVPFGSKTTLLLFKADGKASTKVAKAEAKGVKVTAFSKLKL